MVYRWRYQDSAGGEVIGPDERFDDQASAELWLEDNWPDLLDGGVEQVTLLHNDAEVYGPMSLNPPGE
ncbi:hypothetical protein LX15_003790 [Streptoalloteichus tenebrarius]|uniref:Uncharacterized protein n=1 Tax=Streptoalloteichus tenebrarius (strain ATCC 17920 / DSM 40477 / JCM 4838 / CBS 697.72 / NBRC 16177 / NCIMB 11028 / NRRL B-12390 / A12253. 1 / ISP 5477) TaxID=1933 RepID=A0ABT1HX37_STRSD|nr:hypothetical protein [Streptoalloteichus tenebrarius]MCP2260079.1 hypothetical protein [Streptoalloteichus tenebrarius]